MTNVECQKKTDRRQPFGRPSWLSIVLNLSESLVETIHIYLRNKETQQTLRFIARKHYDASFKRK